MSQKALVIGAAAFWLLLWQAAAALLGNDILLVGPAETALAFFHLAAETAYWQSILNSFLRIGAGLLLASFAGIVLGSLSYRCALLRLFLSPPVSLMKSIPVASFVILAIIWLGGAENLSVFVSFVVVFPMVYLNTLSGLLSTDRKLLEMALVFRMPWLRRQRFIYLPALLPYLAACMRTALGMALKSGVAAELIGQPRGTIGGNLYQAKIYLDTPALFAWTFTIILLSLILEKTVLFFLGRLSSEGWKEEGKKEKRGISLSTQTREKTQAGRQAQEKCAEIECKKTGNEEAEIEKTESGKAKNEEAESGEERNSWTLRWEHLSKSFDGTPVFSDLSGTMAAPESYVLSGESGCGKTTFLRILLGLTKADGGAVSWGKDTIKRNTLQKSALQKSTIQENTIQKERVQAPDNHSSFASSSARRPLFAAVFQEDRLCEGLSAVENVQICTKRGRCSRTDARRELLRLLPAECLERPVRALSGGQRRRVALVRAMHQADAQVLILDEPFTGLDAETKHLAMQYVLEKKKDRLLILSSHDAAEQAAFAESKEQIFEMKAGHMSRKGESTENLE